MRFMTSIVCLTTLAFGSVCAASAPATNVVNINQASEQQLASLVGVGAKRASAIVAYRQAHGKFQTLQDMTSVPGISKNLFEKISRKNEHRLAL